MFSFYKEKYDDGSEFLVFKSLTYFMDADIEPTPKMFDNLIWEEIKKEIIKQVQIHFP